MAIEPAHAGKGFRWRPDGAGEALSPVAAFHAVRRLTYASTGSRDPRDLVREGRGACTAKHLLLAQLLDSLGVPCRVRCVAGDFGRGLPEAADMPVELRTMIRDGGVPDVHNIVVADLDGRPVKLDATWHDAMIPVGFPVNDGWDGSGDTVLAVEGELLDHGETDVLAFKADRIAALSTADQARRRRFLELITQYSATRQH